MARETVAVQRAKAYVEAYLDDRTLDPSRLATAVGLSLRRLQELFPGSATHRTVGRMIE